MENETVSLQEIKDLIIQSNAELRDEVTDLVKQSNNELRTELKDFVRQSNAETRNEFKNLIIQNTAELRNKVTAQIDELKEEVGNLKVGMSDLKEEVGGLKVGMADLDTRMSHIEFKVDKLEEGSFTEQERQDIMQMVNHYNKGLEDRVLGKKDIPLTRPEYDATAQTVGFANRFEDSASSVT